MASLSAESVKRKQERNQRLIAQLKSKTWHSSAKAKEMPVPENTIYLAVAMPIQMPAVENGNALWQWTADPSSVLQAKEIRAGQFGDGTHGLLHIQVSMSNNFIDGSCTSSEWYAWLLGKDHFDVLLQKKEQFQAIDVGLALKISGNSDWPQVWTVVPELARSRNHYATCGDLELIITQH